jgi:hypothetical protein
MHVGICNMHVETQHLFLMIKFSGFRDNMDLAR